MINHSSKLEKEIENLKKQIAINSPRFCGETKDFELVQKLMDTVSDVDMIKLLIKENSPLANKLIRINKNLIEKSTKQSLKNLEKQRERILKQEEKQLQLLESLDKKRKTNLAAVKQQKVK